MRRPVKNRNQVTGDRVYGSMNVSKLINYIMLDGKKSTAETVVYDAFELLKGEDGKSNPVEVFDTAIQNVGPLMEVRSRRVGGANYQVPVEVRPARRLSLALRWIIGAAKSKKGSAMAEKLAAELLAASKNEGEAVAKRDNTHKMADANKAFAHFAW